MDMTEMQPLVQAAALEITTQDPDVHTVGVDLRWNQPVLRAVRRSSLRAQARALPKRVEGLSLVVEEAPHTLVPLHKIPGASAQAATLPDKNGSAHSPSGFRCKISTTTCEAVLQPAATARWERWAVLFS